MFRLRAPYLIGTGAPHPHPHHGHHGHGHTVVWPTNPVVVQPAAPVPAPSYGILDFARERPGWTLLLVLAAGAAIGSIVHGGPMVYAGTK